MVSIKLNGENGLILFSLFPPFFPAKKLYIREKTFARNLLKPNFKVDSEHKKELSI